MLIEARNTAERPAARAGWVALVGNPNTGKTTLFNELTGYHQRVGNYPGVTVERKTGRLSGLASTACSVEIIDLPGAYGLSARSQDEIVVIDTLTGRGTGPRPDLIVAVVDAVNLRRNLFLTSQMLELGVPVVVALNMMDLAEAGGIRIDVGALSAALSVPVVPVVANKGRGIAALKQAIVEHLGDAPPCNYPRMPAELAREIEDSWLTLERRASGSANRRLPVTHVELLQVLLEPDGYGERRLREQYGADLTDDLARRRARLVALGLNPTQVEAEVRYRWIEGIMSRAVDAQDARRTSRSDAADRWVTHPVLGLALLVLIMGAVFQSIYAWTVPVMDFIEGSFNALGAWLSGLVPTGALQSLLVNGVIGGVGAVMTFLPQIMILFLFLAILEDCGYMARAAFLLDRAMGLCGLNGKAFIPLVSSFACAVPGIMSTRTIENRADRLVAILVAPLMSCSARLPVYVLLIAAFIPAHPLLGGIVGLQTLVLIAMYLVGITVAVVVAVFLRRVVFRGENRAFLMELPSYKWPSPKTVLYRVYERAREFVVRAGTIIFAVSILIWALAYYPRPASIAEDFAAQGTRVEAQRGWPRSFGPGGAILSSVRESRPHLQRRWATQPLEGPDREEAGAYLRQSWLGRIGQALEPAVKPLGWDWRIGTAVVASFPAREVVIATLGTIYNLGEGREAESSDLRHALHAATWPDGRPVFNVPVALSIMVFFALCMQCAGTLAVIRRETHSWRWPAITFAYMTTLAYIASFATYRIAGWFV
ncbi:MAG: ferrous iron transport protein B [Planctomycetota bacterium]